ncbi:hypothetical protein DPMN_146144 [Dreissena polymorpha]|uniref:Uncharacterized protein n=1 Tax=Dreissena polymorpha TaxID=45954 RepID=A0A9D4FB93_DREPO|nr:hypothetical protein DPMN_146144 [Dreissena polymorpha]
MGMYYINSTVNPFLYAICNVNFRRSFCKILSGRWRQMRKSIRHTKPSCPKIKACVKPPNRTEKEKLLLSGIIKTRNT